VAGSRQRYVALSFRRVTSWLINVLFVVEGLIELASNQQTLAIWNIALGGFCIYIELRSHKNDDDWFTGRGAKIKRGIRRMLTAPRRQTAPAFGMALA
jgi:hypothetical protein